MKIKNIRKIFNLFVIISIFSVTVFAQKITSGYIPQHWIPTNIEGKNIKNSKAFIEFSEGGNRLTGNVGCNRLFGNFEIKGKNIRFSGVGTTKMFCADENVMKSESSFLKMLNKTTSFKKSGNILKLYAGKRLVSTLKLVKPIDPGIGNSSVSDKLENKKWILEAVKNNPVAQTETAAFIVFNKEKQSAGGNTSCNVFGAEYTNDEKNLKIMQAISTFRACIEDERMNIEKEFLSGLQKTDRFEIKDGKLFLFQAKTLLLMFRGENKE